ncbi:Hypothetical protein GbCGDNIH7_8295 [Granulibacter bethesdensis]|nr:Hypothetical protein GbCGDNIH7_8295 [Granulibacter bethesdensis]
MFFYILVAGKKNGAGFPAPQLISWGRHLKSMDQVYERNLSLSSDNPDRYPSVCHDGEYNPINAGGLRNLNA